ncbi:MAG: phosphoenolpyruvate-utilizing N-terminal domain-containing protein [Desulfotignum sp.]
MNHDKPREMILKGISGSPGICIGKAYLVDREGVNIIERYPVADTMVPREIDRFKSAVAKAKKEHARIIQALDEDVSETLNILETHMALFKDRPSI